MNDYDDDVGYHTIETTKKKGMQVVEKEPFNFGCLNNNRPIIQNYTFS
jgi:hypothetical protein